MEIKEKEKKILELLSEKGLTSTTRIAASISSNLYQAEVYLNNLESNGFIEKFLKGQWTYWKLKEGKENERFN